MRRQRIHVLPLPVVMSWMWLNMPLALIFVAFTVGLPLWVIVKFPESGPADDAAPGRKHAVPREQSSASIPDGAVAAKAARDDGRRAA